MICIVYVNVAFMINHLEFVLGVKNLSNNSWRVVISMEKCFICKKTVWFWQDKLPIYKLEHEPCHTKCAERRVMNDGMVNEVD